MQPVFLPEAKLKGFIQGTMDRYPVIAPVAKRTRFVFHEIVSPDEVRLDYDTTILPPKKVFFPPKQNLVAFDETGYRACVAPREVVLFGVHPHDLKGIAMTDQLFAENHPDHNYLANRKAAIIVGSSVQTPYRHAFFGSVNQDVPTTGHDLFLTKVKGGYVAEALTAKGEALVALGEFVPANDQQAAEAKKANAEAEKKCPKRLKHDAKTIQEKVRAAFSSDIWKRLAEDCFSCGSCNIVCPTCYCFDVQDDWGLGQCDGVRHRRWDACQTAEFSEVAVQGGSENFREHQHERYRHRMMRKAAYLNDRLGGPACIGCGRCTGACTAGIADPVETIHAILEN